MDIPPIETVKIQAQVLVPLVKTLRAELGEEKADALIRQALGDMYRKLGDRWWRSKSGNDLGANIADLFQWTSGADALQYQVTQQAPDRFEAEVTQCRYAQFFKQIGAPELGFLLVCSADYPITEGFGHGVQLTRTQTLMQGASHCDFRYTLDKEAKPQPG
jgi:L-2-amino-thiazoline-4-carboxylic acid hydrolase